MRINQNPFAINAQRNMALTSTALGKSVEKLSSGLRINRAADDAAGLVISQALRAQVSGLKQATRNAQDGISVIQTAEGALNEVHTMLNRMRDLTVQAANTGANDADAQAAAQAEVDELALEITRIADTTRFGGTLLLDGNYDGDFQLGANDGEAVNLQIAGMSAADLGVDSLTISGDNATVAAVLTDIDTAIADVSTLRGTLGALQNRFESTVANLSVTVENLTASESRIRDTDMAEEMANFVRGQVLSQAGVAMMGQANQLPQAILRLLG